MDDTRRVRDGQRFADLDREGERLPDVEARAMDSARLALRTRSITMKSSPWSELTSWMVTMFG